MTVPVTEGERLIKLETQVADLHNDVHDTNEAIKALDVKLDVLSERFSSRPSWSVVSYITLMTSLVVGLAVALATHI